MMSHFISLRAKPTLALYLAGAASTATFMAAPQAEAAVTAVTFGFGTDYHLSDQPGDWNVDGVGGGSFGTLYGFANGTMISLGNTLSYGQGAAYLTGIGAVGTLKFFPDGTLFGAGPIVNGDSGPQGNIGQGTIYYVQGNLGYNSDQAGVIGFQTSSGNWGWADVKWTDATKTLTVKEAYVESVVGAAITANVTAAPEPGRALLALAGLGGVALRRRRKQVA